MIAIRPNSGFATLGRSRTFGRFPGARSTAPVSRPWAAPAAGFPPPPIRASSKVTTPARHGRAGGGGEQGHQFGGMGVAFSRTPEGAMPRQSRCDGFDLLFTIPLGNNPAEPARLIASANSDGPRNWRQRTARAVARVYRSGSGGDWAPLMRESLTEAIDALAVDRKGTVFARHARLACVRAGFRMGAWGVAAGDLRPATASRNCKRGYDQRSR